MPTPHRARHGPKSTVGYWSANQPGLKWLQEQDRASPTPEAYAAIRSDRYRREAHLEDVAGFGAHGGQLMVEVGCGVGTDGSRFLEGGARYLGVDQSGVALQTARKTFDMLGLGGLLVQGAATALPLQTAAVDFIYSNGVLHHIADTDVTVQEINRVLRPGGQCLVMLYHRSSFNYRFNILVLRRIGALLLLVPGGSRLVSRLTGERMEILDQHRGLLRQHGSAYLTDRELFLSNNTDGPGNPLSRVYNAREAQALFSSFRKVELEVHYLNLRTLPVLDRVLSRAFKERLARRWGWHLYVRATR